MIKLQKLLTEEILIKSSEVPIQIQSWVKDKLHVAIQTYKIHQQTALTISIPWHEADIEYYQPFKLGQNNTATPMGDAYRISGQTDFHNLPPGGKLEIPEGAVIVLAGIYPKRAEIFTGRGSLAMLPPDDKFEITDTELLILLCAKSLISSYRPKWKEHLYERLIQIGYLKKNKAISLEGKNYLQNIMQKQEIKDRVINAANKFYEKYGQHLNLNIN